MTGNAVLTESCSSDWLNACQIQERFMHSSRLAMDALDYGARCRQLHAVGGDFYDFLPLGQNRLAVAVGDASGKGLPGALMMSNVQSSVRTALLFADDDLSVAVAAVNHQVYESSLADRYATLFCCVFDSRTRILRYVNAGHQPPMLIRRGKPTMFLESGGAPVGIFPTWNYREGQVNLEPGDVIVACTDGVTEATNADDEQWGTRGIESVVCECARPGAEDMVGSLFAAVDDYTGGIQTDDATVVALRVS